MSDFTMWLLVLAVWFATGLRITYLLRLKRRLLAEEQQRRQVAALAAEEARLRLLVEAEKRRVWHDAEMLVRETARRFEAERRSRRPGGER